MTKQDNEKLSEELVRRMVGAVSFNEACGIIIEQCKKEVEKQLGDMSDDEKKQLFEDVFDQDV